MLKKKVCLVVAVVLLLGIGIFVMTGNKNNLKVAPNNTCSEEVAKGCPIDGIETLCADCSKECDSDCPFFNKEVAKGETGCNGHCTGHNE